MESPHKESVCLCALNMIFGFEPRIATALLDYFGSAAAIFSMDREDMDGILGPHSKYTAEIGSEALDKAVSELENAARAGISFIGRGQDGYPGLLMECEDGPVGIYVRSDFPEECFKDGREYVSIVGTRGVSEYGKDWCRKIVEALAGTGKNPVIVSGLAYGTDITAHLAALDAGLSTIAVMATGADSVYPALHRRHAKRIAAGRGSALISDYPLRTPAIPVNFVRRNRIIAGLGKATILIESGRRGGGMITARQAFSYDREVYALPGRADDRLSEGCNYLIRSGSAVPVVSEKDLVESLGYTFRKNASDPAAAASFFYAHRHGDVDAEKAAGILSLVKRHRRLSVQELAELTGYGYRTVAELAAILENDGFLAVDLMQRCTLSTTNPKQIL